MQIRPYNPCPHEHKVIYLRDSYEVHIYEADVCKHVLNPEYNVFWLADGAEALAG